MGRNAALASIMKTANKQNKPKKAKGWVKARKLKKRVPPKK